jgi:hypothetical protein
MHDLAVQDGGQTGKILPDGLRQRFKRLKRIPVARYQPADAVDIGDSPKAIQFRLEDPVGMLER